MLSLILPEKAMKLKRGLIYTALSLVLVTGALAQTSSNVQHFAKDGLAFDYPAGWAMADQSSGQMQYLTLSRDGFAEIIVRSPRGVIDSPPKEAEAKRLVQDGFVDAWTKNFSDSGAKAQRSTVSTEIAAGPAECTRLSANLGGEPGRVDVCWRLLEKRMVQLTIVGADKDINKTASAWDAVRNSVKIEPPPEPKSAPRPSPTTTKPQS
jgi:hypothetical protein